VVQIRRIKTFKGRKAKTSNSLVVEVVYPGLLAALDPGPARAGYCLDPWALGNP